jgi:hypothetical protein
MNLQDLGYEAGDSASYDFGINTTNSKDGSEISISSGNTLNIDSNNVINYDLNHQIPSSNPSGTYYSYIDVTINDASGQTQTETFWTDNTFTIGDAPTVDIREIYEGQHILNNTTINFNPTITGGSGSLSYSWLDNGSEFSTLEEPSSTFTTGDHNITLVVTDGVGSVSDTVNITSNTPVSITIDSPSDGSYFYKNDVVSLNSTTSNGYDGNLSVVFNGDMEEDYYWDDYGTPTNNERSTSFVKEGTYSRYYSGENGEGITQNISFVEGKTYYYSFWIRNTGGFHIPSDPEPYSNLRLYFGDSEAFYNPTLNTWVEITGSFVATNSDNQISFLLYGGNSSTGIHYIDDLELYTNNQEFSWTDNGVEFATTEDTTHTFSTGSHDVNVEVRDSLSTAQDNISLTVFDPLTVEINELNEGQHILDTNTINFSPTITGGGTKTYSWEDNGVEFSTSQTPSTTFTAGSHEVCLYVTDEVGTVNDCVNFTSHDPVSISIDTPSNGESIYQWTDYSVTSTTSNGYGTQVFDWELDGSTISTSEDFSYVFDTIASSTLSVEVTDDLSSDTDSVNIDIIDNWDANIIVPEYPEDANFFLPGVLYQGYYEVHDKSNTSGDRKYYLDFAFNDTNTFDGTEEYRDANREITVGTTDSNTILSYEIPSSLAPNSLYALTKLYIYDSSDNLIETEVRATDNTFDVNYGFFRFTTYDEETDAQLDDSIYLEDSDGNKIYADENGSFDFLPYERGWNGVQDFTINGSGYETRDFIVYINPYQTIDFNFFMIPEDLSNDIQFLVKDQEDNLWTNQYLRFIQQNGTMASVTTDTLLEPEQYIASTNEDDTDGVLIKTGTEDIYLTQIQFKQLASSPITSFYLYDYNTSAILYRDFTGLSDSKVDFPNLFQLDANSYYSLVFDSNGTVYNSYKKSNELDTNVEGDNLNYIAGCDDSYTSCTSNNAYIVTDISSVIKSNYDVLSSEPYIEFLATDSEGYATLHGQYDGNYIAQLISDNGVLKDIYFKSTVNLKKPLDEKTEEIVTPYDVSVGGLLNYSLTNQSNDVNFNVFAGTVDYYSLQVVDYNSTSADRDYLPRQYLVQVPFGTEYTGVYSLQPYLLKEEDGIAPLIFTFDKLKRPIEDVVVDIYKNIGGSNTLVESTETTSTGRTSFAAYPLDTYNLELYYNGLLKGEYTIQPRTSEDNFYFVLDLIDTTSIVSSVDYDIDWSDTNDSFNITTQDPTANININLRSVNEDPLLSSYSLKVYQNDTLLDTKTQTGLSGTSLDINESFNRNLFNTSYGSARFVLDLNYIVDSETYSINSKYTVGISGQSSRVLYLLQNLPEEIGNIWATILAVLITVAILVTITFTGFVTNTNGITIIGLFLLGIFVFLGWMDTGVIVLGTDIGRFVYVLAVFFGIFLMTKEAIR